jgi:hypothetical protein
MKKWSEKNWLHMLLNQGEFEAVIDDCGVRISDCLATFTVSTPPPPPPVMCNVLLSSTMHFKAVAQMEMLVLQKEGEKWKRDFKESMDADHQAIMKEFAAANFVQRATESRIIDSHNDLRTLSILMQKVRFFMDMTTSSI